MKPLILCIEDEPDLLEVITEELHDAGYEVEQAANGAEALMCLSRRRPHLVLCDIMLPAMDGYALLDHIRRHRPDLASVPFVFLSAQSSTQQIIKGKQAGADDYLVKPIDFGLLLATIAARLEQLNRVNHQLKTQTPNSAAAFKPIVRLFEFVSTGLVLINSDGTIYFSNRAAQRLLSPAPNILQAIDHPKWLESAAKPIQKALAKGQAGHEYTSYFSLPNSKTNSALLITVCSLDNPTTSLNEPVAVLFISGAGRETTPPYQALEALFSLTVTESRVAWGFVLGRRADEIAQQLSIAPTTVAFHKRNIFLKTQTRRQADLIALLLTLPALEDE